MRRDFSRLATEREDPRTALLDRLGPAALARFLVERQRGAFEAARDAAPALAPCLALAAERLKGGGRIVFVGAGTSGRLGVQEAAECIPTFGAIGKRVQAVIAGGARALRRPAEGAEDDRPAGRLAIREKRIGRRDLVIGISASGGAPFVAAALSEAQSRGAATVLVACNPGPKPRWADRQVILRTGPEPLAGSTRMKAGTATKIVLNTLTTGAMALAGRVRGNRMVGLVTTSEKLRARAVRLVVELGKTTPARARRLLAAHGWSVERALRFTPVVVFLFGIWDFPGAPAW